MDLTIGLTNPKRLIVLITECQVNQQDLAHQVYYLAESCDLPVLYLVLVDDDNNMTTALRDMVTMKAVTSANRLHVDAKIIHAQGWLAELRRLTVPQDVLLFRNDQLEPGGSLKAVPVREVTTGQVILPVHARNGFPHRIKYLALKGFQEFTDWVGILAIIAFFTWLQVHLQLAYQGSLGKIMIFVMFIIEMGAIWAWNAIAFRLH